MTLVQYNSVLENAPRLCRYFAGKGLYTQEEIDAIKVEHAKKKIRKDFKSVSLKRKQ